MDIQGPGTGRQDIIRRAFVKGAGPVGKVGNQPVVQRTGGAVDRWIRGDQIRDIRMMYGVFPPDGKPEPGLPLPDRLYPDSRLPDRNVLMYGVFPPRPDDNWPPDWWPKPVPRDEFPEIPQPIWPPPRPHPYPRPRIPLWMLMLIFALLQRPIYRRFPRPIIKNPKEPPPMNLMYGIFIRDNQAGSGFGARQNMA